MDDAAEWRSIIARAPVSPLSNPIQTFPGPVLLPPRTGTLFADLSLEWAGAGLAMLAGMIREYMIRFGLPDRPESDGWATLHGARGDGLYLRSGVDAPAYRTWHGLRKGRLHPLAKERFWGWLVRGAPAAVDHEVCLPAGYDRWWIGWYEPATDVEYGISLYQAVARGFGGAGWLSEQHRVLAEELVAQANRFVPVAW